MAGGFVFTGNSRVEVMTVLANCGNDTDRARQALVTWIQQKQARKRSTDHILSKLRAIELTFIKDPSLHDAFRQARIQTYLPKSPDLPQRTPSNRRSSNTPTIMTALSSSTGPASPSSSSVAHGLPSSSPQSPSHSTYIPNVAFLQPDTPERAHSPQRLSASPSLSPRFAESLIPRSRSLHTRSPVPEPSHAVSDDTRSTEEGDTIDWAIGYTSRVFALHPAAEINPNIREPRRIIVHQDAGHFPEDDEDEDGDSVIELPPPYSSISTV